MASFLVHTLGIDWRLGAQWFEHALIDHDVCSNYGNWVFMAGVAACEPGKNPAAPWGKPTTTAARTAAGSFWNQGGVDSIVDVLEQERPQASQPLSHKPSCARPDLAAPLTPQTTD